MMRMRNGVWLGSFFLTIWGGIAVSKATPFDLYVGSDFVSNYVWRGRDLYSDASGYFKPAVQPSAELVYRDVSIGFWGTWALFSDEDGTRFQAMDAIDTTVTYDKAWEWIAVSVGGTNYFYFNNNALSTSEVFVGTYFPNVPLYPGIKVFYDVDRFKGIYGTVAVSDSRATRYMDIDVGMSLGLVSNYPGRTGANDATVYMGTRTRLWGIDLFPVMAMAFPLHETVNSNLAFWIAVGLSRQVF